MGLEIINTAGNARLAAPSIRLPVSLSGARGFFAMGGDVAASARNRVPGRLAERGAVVGAPVPSPGYCRFRHLTNYLQTVFPETAEFTLACIVKAAVPFAAQADRPAFFGNTVLGGGTRGISLYFQTYTETTMTIIGGATVDNSGTAVAANTQILNAPNPLGWKLINFVFGAGRRDLYDVTDNLTTGTVETRARMVSTENLRIGSTTMGNTEVYGQADICNLIWLPGVVASPAQRTDINALLRADAALVGITA